jgi:LysM repeat protein
VFDTADEGGDVLTLTAMVERFVRPKGNRAGQEAPPRVMFEWGSFLVQGTMESANIDLDLFDAGGIPLRAKVAVSIKGQDPRWTYQPAPTASRANPASNPQAGGNTLASGAPGTQGSDRSPERVVQAMPGESLAQLAARHGLDPSAWRALANGLSNPMQLSVGQEVALPPGLGQGSASGQQAQGQDPARSAASLPLVSSGANGAGSGGGVVSSAGASSGASAAGAAGGTQAARAGLGQAIRQGQAVASQGGLGPAITQVKGQAHQAQARQSLTAFSVNSSAPTADTDDRPWGAGVPLRPRFGSGQAGKVGGGTASTPSMALRSPITSGTSGVSSSTGRSGAATNSPTRIGSGSGGGQSGTRTRSNSTTSVAKGCGCRGRRTRAR